MKKRLLISLLAFHCLTAKTQICFSPATNYSVMSGNNLILSEDINADGNKDLIVSGSTSLATMYGSPTGTFAAPIFYNSWGGAYGICANDFNNDGKKDLGFAYWGVPIGAVIIRYANLTGSFVAGPIYTTNTAPTAIFSADFNNDTKMDLITANGFTNNSISLLLGSSVGTFAPASIYTVGTGPSAIFCADFNLDGNTDVVTPISGGLAVRLGDGMGAFYPISNYAGPALNSIQGADFNGDGDIDLIGVNTSSVVYLLLGGTAGTFSTPTSFTVGGSLYGVRAADFNGDGKMDIAVANNTGNSVSVLLGTGTGSFSAASNFAVGTGPVLLCCADFNSDGRTDIASVNTGTGTNHVSILYNQNLILNPATQTICSGSSATLIAAGVNSYTWNTGAFTSSIVTTPNSSSNYTVSGTSTLGGCVSVRVATVLVNSSPTLSVNNATICSGASAVLIANGATSYTWAGGTLSPSITISPTSTAIYTVTGSFTNNCTSVGTPSVLVNALPNITISPVNTVICLGNSVTLTATGASSYSWNVGPISNTISVNPTAISSYVVIGQNSVTGCSNNAARTVSVNPLPVVTIVPSSTVMCLGKNVILTGGGANSYTWISGPVSSTYSVSPLSNAIYTVTGTSSVTGCSNTAVQAVSVNVLPALNISTSGSVICVGNSASLTASGAFLYSWNTGATNNAIIVTPTLSTNYTVTGTSASTGCSNTAVQTISVNSLPVILISASPTVICYGKSSTLTASGANSYSWSSGPATSTYVVIPLSNGSYTVVGTATLSGCSNVAVQTISVNPLPVISISGKTLVCAGKPTILTASGAASYSWNTGAVGSALNISPTVSTTYSVAGTSSINCINSKSFTVNTTVLSTPSICLVTVDSLGNNNEIYWDKTFYPQADTFFVLRETSSSIYTIIGRIPKAAFSSYIDTNRKVGLFNGNPNFSFYKYKLQYRDTCGNLSTMGPYHQSIYIQDAQTGNFSWNYYFIEGIGNIQTASYILWRQNVLTGATTTVGATSANVANDAQYMSLAQSGNVKWYVSTTGFSCNPSLLTGYGQLAKGAVTRTKSNNTNERQFPTGIQMQLFDPASITLFPNPANKRVTIRLNSMSKDLEYKLIDVSGRIISAQKLDPKGQEINLEELPAGLYFISIHEGNSFICSKKLILQN